MCVCVCVCARARVCVMYVYEYVHVHTHTQTHTVPCQPVFIFPANLPLVWKHFHSSLEELESHAQLQPTNNAVGNHRVSHCYEVRESEAAHKGPGQNAAGHDLGHSEAD